MLLWIISFVNAKYINPPLDQNVEFRHFVELIPKVDSQLKEILTKYNASRVAIFRVYSDYLDKDFGVEIPGTMTKTSIYSVTADGIVAANGVPIGLQEVTHLPGATFAPIIRFTMNEPSTTLNLITEELPHTALKELFERRNTVESQWVAIQNPHSHFAGILQLDWQKRLDPDDVKKISQMLPNDSKSLGRNF